MGKGFLTYSTAVILQAVANGYLYGFDIIDITGVPGGTVYPALRRLEEAGHLASKWARQSSGTANCCSESGAGSTGTTSVICAGAAPAPSGMRSGYNHTEWGTKCSRICGMASECC